MSYVKKAYHSLRKLKGIQFQTPYYNFPAYAPASDAKISMLNNLTTKCINELPQIYLEQIKTRPEVEFLTLCDWRIQEIETSKILRENFDNEGSDKGSQHEYYKIYSDIINPSKGSTLFEVGLGTNNTKLVSNMGSNGIPGASLRAFKKTFPSLQIIGGDIDEDILFKEERINTLYFDQLNPQQMKSQLSQLPLFDTIIDDGLHSPTANIQMFICCWKNLKSNGYYIIEDVRDESIGSVAVGILMCRDVKNIKIIKCRRLNMFVIEKA